MAKNSWWPFALPLQYQLVKNFLDKIGGYAAALGLTAAQVLEMEELCNAFLQTYDFREGTSITNQAVTDWRDQVFNGSPEGDPVSAAPVFAVIGAVTFTRGTVQQFFKKRDYILSLDGYTDAIGQDLGLVGAEITPPDLSTFKPTLSVHPAQTLYLYTVVVGNRGGSDQWEVQYREKGGAWTSAGTFTGKSADITYNAPAGGDPAQLEIRVQLKRKNVNYGQLSDSVTVTVNP